MKFLRILLWSALVTVLVLAGAVALLPVYLERHQDILEAAATRALGRPVEIDGVTLAWSLDSPFDLALAVEGVRVQNPGGAGDGIFARAETVDLRFDLAALRERRIEIVQLVVHGADIELVAGPDGGNNWTLGGEDASAAGGDRVRIRSVRLLDSVVSFHGVSGASWRSEVERLDLAGLDAPQLALDADISIRDTNLSLSGHAGSSDSGRWPFDLQARSEGTAARARGTTSAAFDLVGLAAEIHLEVQHTDALSPLVAVDHLPNGPLELGFQLQGVDGAYRLSEIAGSFRPDALPGPITLTDGTAELTSEGGWSTTLQGRVGDRAATLKLAPVSAVEKPSTKGRGKAATAAVASADVTALQVTATVLDSRLDGRLDLPSKDGRPRFAGELKLGTIDLGAVLGQGLGGPAAGSKGQPDAASLPLDVLRKLDADLALTAETLTLDRLKLTRPSARALLENGRLRLERLALSLPGMKVTGETIIDARDPGAPAVTLDLRADRAELGPALGAFFTPPAIGGVVEQASLTAKAHGATAAALIESLDGTLAARSARLQRRENRSADIALSDPRFTVAAGESVRLRAGVTLEKQSFDIDLTGGTLTELLLEEHPWKRIGVAARGTWRGAAARVEGHVGPLSALLAGRDPGLDLAIDLGGTRVGVTGTLANLHDLDNSRLKIETSGPDLASFTALLGLDLPAGQSFKANARLEGGKQRLDLRDIEASSGGSDVSGNVLLRFGPRIWVDATLASQSLDLRPYLGESSGVVPGMKEPLPLDVLKTLDGSFHLTAGHARFGDFGVDDGALDATLDTGSLNLSARAGKERLAIDLKISPHRDQWRVDLHHKGNLDLAWLVEAEKSGPRSAVPASIDGRLSGVGRSLDSLLGSATGRVEVVLGAGRVDQSLAPLPLAGVFVNLVKILNPTVNLRREAASLRCAALELTVADGIATSRRGIGLQTDSYNVLGGGRSICVPARSSCASRPQNGREWGSISWGSPTSSL